MSAVSKSSSLPARPGKGSRWLERGVRLGYAARALVWGIISVTALVLALGNGGQTQDSQGALRTLAGHPYGQDSLAKSLWMRAYYGIRGALYGFLALSAWRIVTRSGSSGGNDRQSMMSRALELPAGQWIAGAVGVGIVGYGLWQWYRAATRHWHDALKTGHMSSSLRSLVDLSGVAGYLARGVLMGVIGGYVVWGAVTYDPDKAIGTDQALSQLTDTGYGPWVLAVVAVGLLGFALFSLAEAFYRRIET